MTITVTTTIEATAENELPEDSLEEALSHQLGEQIETVDVEMAIREIESDIEQVIENELFYSADRIIDTDVSIDYSNNEND